MSDSSDKQRLIDKLRNSAVSIEIHTPGDESSISEMISTGDQLFVVKGKGIYEVKLADQVDPDRTNIHVPNTVQKILPYGADEPWIGSVVLTAHRLFSSSCTPNTVDGKKAFALVLKIAKELAGNYQLVETYLNAEAIITQSHVPKIRQDRSVVVPAIGDVDSRCKTFLQKSDHALKELFNLVQLFYPDIKTGMWDRLKTKIDQEPQNIDNFSQFLEKAVPFLQFLREGRNCAEHPGPEKRLAVTDFSVDPKIQLLPPMLEIIHPTTPLSMRPVSAFFTQTLQTIVEIVELMPVFLCSRYIDQNSTFPVQIVELPPDRRFSPHVKYGYAVRMGEQIVPMS
ncbi:MAG: hypothetical protein IPP12_18820 [Nitrospira sp.]|nr:hypothetical protein [Nitrospira sp.]